MDAPRRQSTSVFGADLTKADIVEYLKAFTLVLDRDADGIATVVALQEFYRSIGEELDVDGAKRLIRDLQLRCGCLPEVRANLLGSVYEGRDPRLFVAILLCLHNPPARADRLTRTSLVGSQALLGPANIHGNYDPACANGFARDVGPANVVRHARPQKARDGGRAGPLRYVPRV
jgi:hypothetical protein